MPTTPKHMPASDLPPPDWRAVVGWEGFYEVSSAGQVRSLGRSIRRSDGHIYRTAPRLMRTRPGGSGYVRVRLSRPGKRCTVGLHRIVAEAFLDPAHTTETVNHIDGDKAHNHVVNLEWATLAENSSHCVTVLHPHVFVQPRSGESNGRAKLTADQVRSARAEYAGGTTTIAALAATHGVGNSAMWRAIRGVAWSDVPPLGFPGHPEGFEDGFYEDWDDGDEDSGGYPDEEGW